MRICSTNLEALIKMIKKITSSVSSGRMDGSLVAALGIYFIHDAVSVDRSSLVVLKLAMIA